MKKTKTGFTLIEMLVVVLIIGILAAIAVPQYQKAVAKSKASQLLTAVKSLYDAQKAYYLQNGQYAETLKELDITYPYADQDNHIFYIKEDTKCEFTGTYLYCSMSNPNIAFAKYLKTDKLACYAYKSDNYKGDQLCQTLTGTNTWENWCSSTNICHTYVK